MSMVMRALSVALILISACRKQQPPMPAVGDEGPFAPRADSALTLTQIRRWTQVNPLLDSLSFAYRDSFKTQDPAARLSAQKSFQTAQNEICIRQGLRGGYEEYRYITASLALPVNKTLLDSVGIRVFQ